MGIKSLNTLLRENSSEAFVRYPLSAWSGKRIAIDSTNVIYERFSTAWKDVVNKTNVVIDDPDPVEVNKLFLEGVKRFVWKLLDAGITPIFVNDGRPPPEKETITRTKRRAEKTKRRDVAVDLREKLSSLDRLAITPSMIEDLRKKMRQIPPVSGGEIEAFKAVMIGAGIPVLQATGEAEELCSTLCRLGMVDAVYSTDTDNLVHGCPVVITDFSGRTFNQSTGRMEEYVTVTILHEVLKGLELRHVEFVDMCIMIGCDYNTNMPRIGLKTSFKLIKEHRSIDALPQKYDTTCLNHVRCRELFSAKTYEEICEEPDLQLKIDREALQTYGRDHLQSYGVDGWIKELMVFYQRLPEPSMEFRPVPVDPPISLNIVNRSGLTLKIVGPTLSPIVNAEPIPAADPKLDDTRVVSAHLARIQARLGIHQVSAPQSACSVLKVVNSSTTETTPQVEIPKTTVGSQSSIPKDVDGMNEAQQRLANRLVGTEHVDHQPQPVMMVMRRSATPIKDGKLEDITYNTPSTQSEGSNTDQGMAIFQ